MDTSNETMVTKNRWVVNCTTFYHDGDTSNGMVWHFATKAEAVKEYRHYIYLARQDKDTVKVVRFGNLEHGVKGRYSNRLYSVTCEQITMPAYMW